MLVGFRKPLFVPFSTGSIVLKLPKAISSVAMGTLNKGVVVHRGSIN